MYKLQKNINYLYYKIIFLIKNMNIRCNVNLESIPSKEFCRQEQLFI